MNNSWSIMAVVFFHCSCPHVGVNVKLDGLEKFSPDVEEIFSESFSLMAFSIAFASNFEVGCLLILQ